MIGERTNCCSMMCVIYLLHHQAFAGCAELDQIYVFLINQSSPPRVQIEGGRQIESSHAAWTLPAL